MKLQDIPETCVCEICGAEQYSSQFLRKGWRDAGKTLSSRCNTCREQHKGKPREDLWKKVEGVATANCTGCDKAKPLSEFPTRRTKHGDIPHARCYDCKNERQRDQKQKFKYFIDPKTGNQRCNTCFRFFPPDQFVNKQTGAVTAKCDVCLSKERVRHRNKKIAYGERETPLTRFCPRCKQTKSKEEFAISRARADGLHTYCKVCSALRSQERRGSPVGRMMTMLTHLRSKCKKQNIPFDLDIEYLSTLYVDVCPALGLKLDYYVKGHSAWNSPSIDRFYPEVGYVKGNVSIISNRANTLKLDATVEEVEAVARWMRNVVSSHMNSSDTIKFGVVNAL